MPRKLDRCVRRLKAKGVSGNPWAICNAKLKKKTKKRKEKGR